MASNSFDTSFPHQSYGQDLLRPQQDQSRQSQQPQQQFQQQPGQQNGPGGDELNFDFSGLSLGPGNGQMNGQSGARGGYNLPNLPGRRRGACKFFNSQVRFFFP